MRDFDCCDYLCSDEFSEIGDEKGFGFEVEIKTAGNVGDLE